MQSDTRNRSGGQIQPVGSGEIASEPAKPSFAFPRAHRLSGKLAFAAVYDARKKITRGPLAIYSLPNDLPHARLGLSVSRRVGTAPQRNRIKRMLREAFRLKPWTLPRGYDLVVVVRAHPPMKLADYQPLLADLILRSHRQWK